MSRRVGKAFRYFGIRVENLGFSFKGNTTFREQINRIRHYLNLSSAKSNLGNTKLWFSSDFNYKFQFNSNILKENFLLKFSQSSFFISKRYFTTNEKKEENQKENAKSGDKQKENEKEYTYSDFYDPHDPFIMTRIRTDPNPNDAELINPFWLARNQFEKYIIMLIGANLAVLIYSKFSNINPRAEGEYIIKENFTVSLEGLKKGYYWTLLSSGFYHETFLHFLISLYTFRSFVRPVLLFTRYHIFSLYAIGSVASSLGNVFWEWITGRNRPAGTSAGAMLACLSGFLFCNTWALGLLGKIPFPHMGVLAIFYANELFAGTKHSGTNIGGLTAGALAGYFLQRKFFPFFPPWAKNIKFKQSSSPQPSSQKTRNSVSSNQE